MVVNGSLDCNNRSQFVQSEKKVAYHRQSPQAIHNSFSFSKEKRVRLYLQMFHVYLRYYDIALTREMMLLSLYMTLILINGLSFSCLDASALL